MSTQAVGQVGTQLDVLGSRIVAALIDTVVAGIGAAGTGILLASGLAAALEPDPDGFVLVASVVAVLGYFVYFVGLEATYSRTVGKRLVGIVVTCGDGTAISWEQAVIRNTLRIVDGWFYYGVGLLVVVFSSDEQRLGDIVADTFVVRARD